MKYKNFYITIVALGLFSNLFSSGRQIPKQTLNDSLIALIKANAPTSEIQSLLDAGANPDSQESLPKQRTSMLPGETPIFAEQPPTALMIAAKNRNIEAIQALLKAGANPNMTREIVNMTRQIIRQSAASFLEDVQRMKKDAVTINIIELLLAAGLRINHEDKEGSEGESLLRYAIKCNSEQMVRNLLKAGAIANQPTWGKLSRSFVIQAIKAKDSNINIIAMLLDAGVDVNEYINNFEQPPHTALEVAIIKKDIPVINMLLSRGASPTAKDNADIANLLMSQDKPQ